MTEEKTFLYDLKFKRFIISSIVITIFFLIGIYRLEIDTDIINSLPVNDSVISNAVSIFLNHPIQDHLFIDVSFDKNDLETLVECGNIIEKKLSQSQLFKKVGIQDSYSLFPEIITHVVKNLPILFSEESLKKDIENKITPLYIHKKLSETYKNLNELSSIGQSDLIAKDPLDFKDSILSKLSHLAPTHNVKIYKGKILSYDSKHLLIIATPNGNGTDTKFASNLVTFLDNLSKDINKKYENKVFITPIGAYRAAFDNENIVKKDVNYALTLAAIGNIVLLLLCFSRPLIGIMSMLPAIFGPMMALFVFSLFHKSIPLMVLGFGGAIISMTVDYGIAYLLFLDQQKESYGKEASKQVWGFEFLSALTAIGSFGLLSLSGIPILIKLGQFTALGIFFSFLFVHTIFPFIFPKIPGAAMKNLYIQKAVDGFANLSKKGKIGAYLALFFCIIMFLYAKPEFNINLSAMNTVSNETSNAEKNFTNIWGNNFFSKIYIMITGNSLDEVQKQSDILLETIDKESSIRSAFIPSMIFPGEKRADKNLSAWKKFWNKDRIKNLKLEIDKISNDKGFTADAFDPFLQSIINPYKPDKTSLKIKENFFEIMGISLNKDKTKWVQFSGFSADVSYDSEKFFNKFQNIGKIFDPPYFSKKLGDFLFFSFINISIIICICVAIILLFYLVSFKLTLIAMLPAFFAMICTLGTLNIIKRPLDIPTLMLSIMIFGTGIEYAVYFIISYQRYGDDKHPAFSMVRRAVFMNAGTTMIGLGILSMAHHNLLKSVGLNSLLGIGYSLVGAFLIIPSLSKFICSKPEIAKNLDLKQRVLRRYKNLETYSKMFARCKIAYDAMFDELSKILTTLNLKTEVKTIIDIGCGYGVPACWLIETYLASKIFGIEPDAERARVASRALEERGHIECASAPNIPKFPDLADIVIMLDMTHYLNNNDLNVTLQEINKYIKKEGILIMRVSLPANKNFSFIRFIENIKLRSKKMIPFYRTLDDIQYFIKQAGFTIELTSFSQSKDDIMWIISKPKN